MISGTSVDQRDAASVVEPPASISGQSVHDAHYVVPYRQLLTSGVSFAEWAQRKEYYNQLAFLFEAASSRNPHTDREVKFILAVTANGGSPPNSLLDVACGVGRHARQYSQRGIETFGLDASAALLAIARAQDPKTIYTQADMRSFDLGRTFGAITCLWEAYPYLSRPEDLEAFLNCSRQSLNHQGFLVLDSRNFGVSYPVHDQRSFTSGDWDVSLTIDRTLHESDRVLEGVFSYSLYNRGTGETFLVVDQELIKTYHWSDLKPVLESSGFVLERIYGDFDDSASFDEQSSPRQILLARKS